MLNVMGVIHVNSKVCTQLHAEAFGGSVPLCTVTIYYANHISLTFILCCCHLFSHINLFLSGHMLELNIPCDIISMEGLIQTGLLNCTIILPKYK